MRIKIKQYSFEISSPFAEGTILTQAEAQALNALRAENIRNNMSRVVERETAAIPEGGLLSTDAVAGLQAQITRYDERYKFPLRFAAEPSGGAIEAEARNVAEEQLAILQRQGDLEGLSQVGLSRELARLVGTDYVQAEARRRLEARASVSARALSELEL